MINNSIIPPHNPEIEKALLRNIITVGNAAVDEIIHLLKTPELFYNDKNRSLYNAIIDLHRKNSTIDFLTIAEKDPNLSDYVLDIVADAAITPVSDLTNADYINILQQKWVKRRAIEAVYKFQQKIFDVTVADAEAYYEIEKTYQQMADILHGKQNIASMQETVNQSVEKLYERIEIRKSGKLPGINTGLRPLNIMIAGWQQGELYVIAARPGMGKTALALHFAQAAATESHAVLFFSLEMAKYKLTDRLIIGETGINSSTYHHAEINNLDQENILAKANYLSKLPIFFDEAAGIDIDYITSTSRIAKRKNEISLIIIDYLQLIDMREKPGQSRDQAIGIVTRKLKQLSKELEIPIILLSQLNRAVEARADKEPTLADLRESGNIEQDADVVLMLYRPAYYKIPEYRKYNTDESLWILTKKYRNGLAQDIEVKHNKTLTKFSNYDRQEADAY
jgi:replicative DNA helicase